MSKVLALNNRRSYWTFPLCAAATPPLTELALLASASLDPSECSRVARKVENGQFKQTRTVKRSVPGAWIVFGAGFGAGFLTASVFGQRSPELRRRLATWGPTNTRSVR